MKRSALEAMLAICTILGVAAGASKLAPRTTAEAPSRASHGFVRDASGTEIPRGPRRCIVSASTVSDRLVTELVGPQALCAVATPQRCTRPWCVALREKPRFSTLDDLALLTRVAPDLVITANPGPPARLLRLREAGLAVFDIGPGTGLESLREATRALGRVLDVEPVAEAYWSRFMRRMRSVAPDGLADRPRALYLGLYGSTLVGGARDTSWHDVLETAGLRDAAEDRTGWPSWSAIDVAERNPSVIVTETGMGAALCARDGLSRTEACATGRIAEIDSDLLGDPGPTMLEASEALANRIAELSARR